MEGDGDFNWHVTWASTTGPSREIPPLLPRNVSLGAEVSVGGVPSQGIEGPLVGIVMVVLEVIQTQG